ncbi:MAG: tetratricopeptide repeat protein, partial [Acidobacteriota bacterium]
WFHAYRLPEAAELAYGNALVLEPKSPRWHYLRGVLLSQTGRPAEAAEHFAAAVEAGADSAASVRLAEVEVELGRIESAVARLEPAAAGDGGRSVRAKVSLARGLLARAGASGADRLRAAELMEEALKLQPRAPGVRYQLATLYRELGDGANAERHLGLMQGEAKDQPLRMSDPLGRELEEMDVSYLGHLGRGRRAAAAERHQQALRHFTAAQAVDPDRFAARFAAAKSLLSLGRDGEARRAAAALLEVHPERSEAHLLLGRLYRRDADDRSLEAFSRAVELDPDSVPARRQLATELRRRGQLQPAIEELERARSLQPASHLVAVELADVLVESGAPERARLVLEEALPTVREPWAVELALEKLVD